MEEKFKAMQSQLIFDMLNESNKCEECGGLLIRSKTRVPYGDTFYDISELHCPKCN